MADDVEKGVFPDEQQIIVDRSRITHGQNKRSAVAQIEIQRAQEAGDAEKVAALLDELDQMVRKVIVSMPASWLPDGVTLDREDWLDTLPQDKYARLLVLSGPERPGEKKG